MGVRHSNLEADLSNTITHPTTHISSPGVQARRRVAQNYLLIWLDSQNDELIQEYQTALVQIRRIINDVTMVTQVDQCVQFVRNIKDEKIFVIASGSLGQQLVPKIHTMTQVDTIYIYCSNKTYHQDWAKDWTKIKGVHTNMKPICEALQLAVRQCNQDTIAISSVPDNEDTTFESLSIFNLSFLYTQVLKQILPEQNYDQKSIKDFATYCREIYDDNEDELKMINEFERDYQSRSSIWWYTRECFVYQMLNRAIRMLEVDTILNLGFFIHDLHEQIEQLHQKEISNSREIFIVYRGQGLSKTDFVKLQECKGGLMVFNNFLSAIKNPEVSFDLARIALGKTDTVGILFKLTIDPSISSAPFASISKVSYFQGQDGILFSIGAVFRIGEVKRIGEDNALYQMELKLAADDDQQLRTITQTIQEGIDGFGWQRMGTLLVKMHEFHKAELLYTVLLEQTSNTNDQASYYDQLGYVKRSQYHSEQAIWYYEKAHDIRKKTLPSNHPDLALCCNAIGTMYHNRLEYSKALPYYQKALAIRQNVLSPNHPDLATSYSTIGTVYYQVGEYSQALSSHEKALEIYQKTLPSNHPTFAVIYDHISEAYGSMGEHSKVLVFYEKALEIRQRTLPINHRDLARSYRQIAQVYKSIKEYSKAISYYEKELEIEQKILPIHRGDLAEIYKIIGTIYEEMEDYSNALTYYERALHSLQIFSSHPRSAAYIQMDIKNIKQKIATTSNG